MTQLIVTCLADVEPQTVRWLWPSRFPMGKLSILAGDCFDDCTHYIIDDMAARLSRGNPWPDTPGIENPIGSVIALHPMGTDMVLGRMGRAGADMHRVFSLDALYHRRRNGSYPRFFINRDLADLEAAIDRIGDVRLVVFDTLQQHLGPGVKMRAPGSVGPVLQQLVKMAERTNVAVIGMMHVRRSSRSVACLTGAVPSAARAIWFVVDDPDDLDAHHMLPAKVINGKPGPGLSFQVRTRASESKRCDPGIRWRWSPNGDEGGRSAEISRVLSGPPGLSRVGKSRRVRAGHRILFSS